VQTVAVLMAILGIVLASSLNWRLSVKSIFFLLVIEGVLRKWVLPQSSDLIYFLKDIVLLGAYIRYFLFSSPEFKFPIKNSFLNIFLFLATVWCLFQAFNPSLGSPLVGLFGLRGYLFYIPLMWMMPNLFRSEEELYQFLRWHLLLLIPVCLLGIAQFASPVSSPINVYAGGKEADATFQGVVKTRITGSFSYINNYVAYLTVCFALLCPMLIRKQQRWWQWASIVELALLTANAFMTGSRSIVLFEVLFLISYFSLLGFKQASIIAVYVRRFSIPLILTVVVSFTWFRSALDAFLLRSTSSDNLSDRIWNNFIVFDFFKYKQLDGYGTGATHQAISTLRNILDLSLGETVPPLESEMSRIAVELGPLGFFFWYGLRIALLLSLFQVFWKLKRPFLRQLALAAFLVHAIQISGQLVVHHTFLVYYWFLSGFIFLLPWLEQVENWHQQQNDLNQNVSSSYFSSQSDS